MSRGALWEIREDVNMAHRLLSLPWDLRACLFVRGYIGPRDGTGLLLPFRDNTWLYVEGLADKIRIDTFVSNRQLLVIVLPVKSCVVRILSLDA